MHANSESIEDRSKINRLKAGMLCEQIRSEAVDCELQELTTERAGEARRGRDGAKWLKIKRAANPQARYDHARCCRFCFQPASAIVAGQLGSRVADAQNNSTAERSPSVYQSGPRNSR